MNGSKVVVQPRTGQRIPPVLQKLLQRQQELNTDSHDTSSEGKSEPSNNDRLESTNHDTPPLSGKEVLAGPPQVKVLAGQPQVKVLAGQPQVKGIAGSNLGQTSSVFSPNSTGATSVSQNETVTTSKPMPNKDAINTLPNSGQVNSSANLTSAKYDTLPASPKVQPTGAELSSFVGRKKEAQENTSTNMIGQSQLSKCTAPSTNRFVTSVSTCAALTASFSRHSLSKSTLSSSTLPSSSSLFSSVSTNETTTSENEGPVSFGVNLRKTVNSVIEQESRLSQRQQRASSLLPTRDLSETSLTSEMKSTQQSVAVHQTDGKSNATRGPPEHSSPGPPATHQGELALSNRQGSLVTFRKLNLGLESMKSNPPAKCPLPEGVDITDITIQYRLIVKSGSTLSSAVGNVDDEDYTDARSLEESIRQWTPGPEVTKNNGHRSSDITSAVYDDGYTLKQNSPIDDEEYIEMGTNGEMSSDETEEIYDDGTTMPEEKSNKDKKRQQKEMAEAKKRQEKERKEKGKEEQRLLKEKKAKEKKENEKKTMGDLNEVIGEGILQEDVKNLKLKRGQTVTIVRLNDNPPNMWLVKKDNIVGYVNSKIVKVEPAIILQAMTKHKKSIDEQEEMSIYDQL